MTTPLFHADSYRTSDARLPVRQNENRVCSHDATYDFRPSLRFYPPVLWIVIKSGILSMRGKYDGAAWARSSEQIVSSLERVGCRLDVTGLEQFRSLEGPCIFIGNHMSTLETFVLPAVIQPWRDVTFVVKQSLLKYPFFGPVLASRDPVVVGRQNPREDFSAVLEGGTARLAAGRSIIVFPQSTRSPNFDPAQFNTIGIKLAKRAGVSVVPLALKTDAWSNGRHIKDFGPIYPERTIHFAFGEPFRVESQGKEEHRHIIEFICSRLEGWKTSDSCSTTDPCV